MIMDGLDSERKSKVRSKEKAGGEGDVWARRCALLKRKCEEYEEVSG